MTTLSHSQESFLNEVSDDVYGLWEADWAMNSLGFMSSRKERALFIARLICDGLLEMRFGRLGTEGLPTVPIGSCGAILDDPTNWRPRKNRDQNVYSVTATDRALVELGIS